MNARSHTSLRLGLTGGIGSGKSTVASGLSHLGADLIDADAIARACTQSGGAAMTAIAQSFGKAFISPDGSMDRERMRDHVFHHPAARSQLEAIIHPIVGAEIARRADNSRAPCIVFDVPLLVESARWRPQLDRVLVVDCRRETQITRVMARNGWDRSTVESVIDSQSPRLRRLNSADMVLFNDDLGLEQLRALVKRLAQRIGL